MLKETPAYNITIATIAYRLDRVIATSKQVIRAILDLVLLYYSYHNHYLHNNNNIMSLSTFVLITEHMHAFIRNIMFLVSFTVYQRDHE